MIKLTAMRSLIQMGLLLYWAAPIAAQPSSSLSIIPEPREVETVNEHFSLSPKTVIFYSGEAAKDAGGLLKEFIKEKYGYKLALKAARASSASAIWIEVDRKAASEGYQLSIRNRSIRLTGNIAGLFYALQTLQQLAPGASDKLPSFSGVMIKDEPRFAYRGLMLDVCRHFYSLSYIKQFLDVMAHYKLNRFHWHLTDDQGWRIEIKKYPKLQSVAAWREPVDNVRNSKFIKDGRYGGYYTQEEVKNVVAYAAKRHITVVPEIEMPGHSTAALAAYPNLGCTGGPYKVMQHGGIMKEVFCAGNDSTFLFLQDVLTEVIPLFPGEYVHVGGDETPKDRWSECPKCQKRMKEQGLKNEHELQSYFVQRVEKFVNSKGRKIIGWDEILEGGLAPNATVMSWRGEIGGIAAARQRHDVIMSPYTYFYLDYYQGDPATEPPAFPAFLPLSKVYSYEPLSDALSEEQHQYIKGVQANLWCENIRDERHANYMLFPRALALSEIGWSAASAKNYIRFHEKLKMRLAAMEQDGINFRIPEPLNLRDEITTKSSVLIDLSPTVEGASVYYTLDGSDPTNASENYTKPFLLALKDDEPVVLKVMLVLGSGRQSAIYSAEYIKKPFKPALLVNPLKNGIGYLTSNDKVSLAKEMQISDTSSRGLLQGFNVSSLPTQPQLGVIYDGFIAIDADDIYTFKLTSDDGSVLYLDDELVVDNDGEHAPMEVLGSMPLRKGYHKIRLHYFDAGGGRHLDLKVSNSQGDYPLTGRLFTD
ncbi:family 20 glycosylhydrolase [Arcticibacter sp.]|uniref:family 20 glycosylhydrolase n=1 Tax=Arcticibacter sp. TaxID=1872630 RepID=UPI00388E4E94